MHAGKDLAALIGRIMLALIFVASGFNKIGGFAGTAAALAGKGLPLPEVLVVATVALELAGSLAIIAGWKTRWGAAALLLFTVLATVMFHNFWAAAPDQMQMQQTHFMKNLAIMGGLLVLWAFGPGRYALERQRR